MLLAVTDLAGGTVRIAAVLVRGALPALAVATLIPLGLFYLAMSLGSVDIAIGLSVVYAYGAGLWQHVRRPRVSGMLMVTIFMVTVRSLAVLASGRPFFYFVAPVIETVGFGLLFVASLASRECLIVRLARDVVPSVAGDLAERARLCRLLSAIWAMTYIGSGATTFVLLVTQPLPVYLGAHQLTGWAWNGAGLTASLLLCRWRARGLLTGLGRHIAAVPALVSPATEPDLVAIPVLASEPLVLAPLVA
jgi:hypothetical protein